MKLKKLINSLYFVIFLLPMSCSHSTSEPEVVAEEPEQLLQITSEEFEFNKMQIDNPGNQYFEEAINCTGYIKAETGGMAQISSPVSGILSSVKCTLGDYVKKGQLLALISSNELILMQQEFIETSVGLNQLKSEYDRISILYEDKISSEKDFLAIESQYKAMAAKYKSLKLRLENMQLNTTKIESGDLYAAYPVTASISGYISKQNMILGQFAEPQNFLAEIVNVNKLQLHLSVFESDISKLKTGQDLRFNILGEKDFIHSAKLSSIGKTIDADMKAIECLAKINFEKDFNFINQAYVEASIIVERNEKPALPNAAIIKSGNDFYVFALEKMEGSDYLLKKHQVILGKSNKQYTEIVNGQDLKNVLISGVYNLNVE